MWVSGERVGCICGCELDFEFVRDIPLERRWISPTAPVPMRVSASIGMWEGWSHLTDIVDMVVSAVLL